jgi:magnesium chelatase family protein
MTLAEAIEIMRIHSVAGLTGGRPGLVTSWPFRAPHHTISDVGLIGGGEIPMPGEVSLAHHAVCCWDELPEFRRQVLAGLHQPAATRGGKSVGTTSRASWTSRPLRPSLPE